MVALLGCQMSRSAKTERAYSIIRMWDWPADLTQGLEHVHRPVVHAFFSGGFLVAKHVFEGLRDALIAATFCEDV